MSRIIAGDIGGTKVLLEEREVVDGRSSVVRQVRFESRLYPTFDALLEEFLGSSRHVDAICLAVAGPVTSGVATITNLPWLISEHELSAALAGSPVRVVNDFHAVAHVVPQLGPVDLITINEGRANPSDPIAVIGAGTGLGEAILVADDEQSRGWRVIPSEGGHCDFAPTDDTQASLLLRLRQRHGHVSCERVVSGPGLENIYEFVCELESEVPAAEEEGESGAAMISRLAAAGDPVAMQTFEIFVNAYGSEAGNLALKVLARGGVFIAGGVAAKNVDHFTNGRFLEAFLSKGRLRDVLEQCPVHIITNMEAGLMGAANLAHAMLGGEGVRAGWQFPLSPRGSSQM